MHQARCSPALAFLSMPSHRHIRTKRHVLPIRMRSVQGSFALSTNTWISVNTALASGKTHATFSAGSMLCKARVPQNTRSICSVMQDQAVAFKGLCQALPGSTLRKWWSKSVQLTWNRDRHGRTPAVQSGLKRCQIYITITYYYLHGNGKWTIKINDFSS